MYIDKVAQNELIFSRYASRTFLSLLVTYFMQCKKTKAPNLRVRLIPTRDKFAFHVAFWRSHPDSRIKGIDM